MEIKSKLVVLGLVENNNHEFLICQRYEPDLPEVHLKWDFPGGTNEAGESLEETVRRELLEETGLEVEVLNFLPQTVERLWKYSDHHQETVVHCCLCRLVGGVLCGDDHKINDLKWISKERFTEFDFLPTTKEFIDIIIS
jgi:ADP-ribose pyrophosphatase YjhB (NUDIX family)